MGNFTKSEAIKIQREQIDYYQKQITDQKEKARFMKEIRELKKRNAKAKTPYEIPRGTEIERIFYKIHLGYSDEQYWDYVGSLD